MQTLEDLTRYKLNTLQLSLQTSDLPVHLMQEKRSEYINYIEQLVDSGYDIDSDFLTLYARLKAKEKTFEGNRHEDD